MISQCINSIKVAIKNNKKGILIKKTNRNIKIVESFIKINVLKFTKIEEKTIIAYINYNNEKPIYFNIVNLHKRGHKNFINLKNLHKLSKKHNWNFLLSTSRGILTSKEAIKYKTGGLLLAQFWN